MDGTASITTLRPSAVSSASGWTPSAGTLYGVTSDDSDATYATWAGDGSPLILATPVDSPPAGERRHQVRMRARGEDGDAWWSVRLASGALTAAASAQFPTSPATVVGSWGFGAPPDNATILYTYVSGQTAGLRITELYIDMDSREAPTLDAQVLDGSGVPSVAISDTTQPVIRADNVELDGLNPRQFRYWVTEGATIVWDTGIVSGPSVNRTTDPLPNGSYTAHVQVWSTLGASTAYASDEETLAFTLSVGLIPAPDNPTVDLVDGTPFYEIEACAPYVGALDGDVGYVEIQRVDCASSGPSGEATLYDFEDDAEGWVAEGAELVQKVTSPNHGGGSSVQIPSGQFSGSVANWYGVGGAFSYSTAQFHSAPGAALITVSGSPGLAYTRPDGPSQSTQVIPGRDYRVTAWIRCSNAVADAGVAIDWFDSGVGYLSTDYLSGGAVAANTWTPFAATFTAPVSSFYASHGPNVSSPANGTLVFFDDIELIEVATHDGTGSLEASEILGAGVQTLRFNDDFSSLRDLTVQGQELTAWVLVPAVATGTGWSARLELQEPGLAWQAGSDTALTPGTWAQLTFTPDPALMASCRSLGIQVSANNVNGPAVAYADTVTIIASGGGGGSDPSSVTVALLGPLETGECATWTDYTLPRTGVGATCDHDPGQCCSYYRARTVGRINGDLRVSNWSDVYDPAIPAGVIVMWPGTNASVPSGWDRVTALDGKYPKGIATSVTEPGTLGGAATHLHTTPGHVHDEAHLHTSPTPTAAATGTVNAPNTAGALKVLSSHTHTRPSTAGAVVSSASTSPSSATVANDPARLEVIWAESDGSPLGVPNGALAFAADISLTGWTDYASAANRFFKGAAAAGNGGATAASAVDSHTHTIDAHVHAGTSHGHNSSNTGTASSTLAPATGTGSVTSAATHDHPIVIGSSTTSALVSASGGSSGAASADMRPPFRNVRVKENTSGGVSLPVGLICAWRGEIGGIPENWALCDGTGGRLNLTGVFPQGATSSIGTSGGSAATHTHTGGSHTHTTTGHSHTATTGVASAAATTAITTATVVISTAAHTHVLSDVTSATPTVGSITSGTLAAAASQPPFEEVAFIQMTAEPSPPPDPDVFCLTWDDDEHLVRSTGPDGPVWAPVLGKFEWTVDRPFTAATGVNGSRFVTSAPPGGRNLSMIAAVESEAALAQLRAVLARPLVLISPSDATEVWAAPVAESVRVIKVGRIRQISATFIGTGPQPAPQLADVE